MGPIAGTRHKFNAGKRLPAETRGYGELPELAKSDRNGLPIVRVLGIEFGELFHQVEGHAVNFDRIDGHSARKPLAPTSGISAAPLPEGGSFLNHGPSRSASVPYQVTTYLFPSRATPVVAERDVIEYPRLPRLSPP